MARPQRERRVPSRFREAALPTASAANAKVVPSEPEPAPAHAAAPPGPAPSKKRRLNAVPLPILPPVNALPVVAVAPATVAPAASAPVTLTHHAQAEAIEEAALQARLLPVNEPAKAAASFGGAPERSLDTGQQRHDAAETAAVNTTAGPRMVEQREVSSDSSDVQIVEERTPATKKSSVWKNDTGATSAKQHRPAAPARGIPPDSAARPSSSAPRASAPLPPPSLPQGAPAPTMQKPEVQRTSASTAARLGLHDLAKASPHKAVPKQGLATPTKPPAPIPPVEIRSSCTDTQPAVPSVSPPHTKFLPLFRREATPARPDFSDGDSDSDGFNILEQRRKEKATVHSAQKGSSASQLLSPGESSPDSRLSGPQAHPASKTSDPDWLKLPSPEPAYAGAHTGVAESATLIRLRQKHGELLALARGASLAPERIQAQSAAEARELERELEKEAAIKEAEANARAAAKVAAALARCEKKDASEEEEQREAEGAGAGQSVIVKIRASDGSQERFKVKSADPLEKLFKAYLKKVYPQGPPAGAVVRFKFDGDPVNEKQTPEELGLEDDDIIEVEKGR